MQCTGWVLECDGTGFDRVGQGIVRIVDSFMQDVGYGIHRRYPIRMYRDIPGHRGRSDELSSSSRLCGPPTVEGVPCLLRRCGQGIDRVGSGGPHDRLGFGTCLCGGPLAIEGDDRHPFDV